MTVYGYFMQSGLPAELVDLVYLLVSQISNCAYCLDMHTRDLIKKGVKIEQLALVQAWAEAGHLFSERERAALAWAEAVTRVSEACRMQHSGPRAQPLRRRSWSISPSRSLGAVVNSYLGFKLGLVQRSKGQFAVERSVYQRGGAVRLMRKSEQRAKIH